MKNVIRCITIYLVFFVFSVDKVYSENNTNSSMCYIGIWDYKFHYIGTYSIESKYFGDKERELHNAKVDAIYQLIKEQKENYYYILVANDTNQINLAAKDISNLDVKNYWIAWLNSCHTSFSYKLGGGYKPDYDILPNGHWLDFSTEIGKIGVELEKYVKDHYLDVFFKSYNLEKGIERTYFEVRNQLLDGIDYFCRGIDSNISYISIYQNGICKYNIYDRQKLILYNHATKKK